MWRLEQLSTQDASRVRRRSRHPLVFVRTVSGYTLASMSGSETTILIADDEPIVLNLAATALESAGYRVLKARNGREALEACQRHQGRIDLGLLDYFMHRMTGDELCHRLMELYPNIRIALMTGYVDGVVQAFGTTPGPRYPVVVLRKPFVSGQLISFAREHMQGTNER